jgi:hypothetical protein
VILPLLLASVQIVVDPDQALNPISPAMYGSCIEDVNHEIYGGLYAQRIFGESFEEPAPGTSPRGWRVLGDQWTPDGDGVHVRGGNGPKLLWDTPDVGDGTVEADVLAPNDLGENAGLLVRVSNAGVGADDFDGYEVSISGKRRQIILGKHHHNFTSLQTVSAPIVPDQWHRIRVAMAGSLLRVFLDGETSPRIDFTDPQAPLTSGTFAVRAWQSNASFRNLRFNGQAVPLSLAGDGVSGMWDRVLTGAATASYAVEEAAFNGKLCQKVRHLGGKGTVGVANRGLNRWGIAVRKGHTLEGRIYLHGDVGTATVALQSADGSRTYASQHVPVVDIWSKANIRLKPNASDANARFAVWIDRPGTVWLDQAVLMDAPEDRFQGLPIRKDIAQAMLGSGVRFLRYGGTMVNMPGYRWKSMIGDPDRRPPYAGHWYPCSTNGFGIFDFLRFCEKAKLGAAFAINVDETPEDVADLAEYLTGPLTSTWGRRRVQDGHPKPYRVEYIEIGNEEAIGNPDAEGLARYARRFRVLAEAIHRRDPRLKLVCSAWWVPDSPSMKGVFEAVDGQAASWDFHFWCDDPNAGSGIDRELNRAERLFKSWNPNTTLKAVVFEENGNRHDHQRALGHATTLNATRRHGDFVLADCAANALQPWHQNDNGWDQGQIFFTPERAWPMPPALAQRVLSDDHLPVRISAMAGGGLDVLAAKSLDGRTITLTVVNLADREVSARVLVKDFRVRVAKARAVSDPAGVVQPTIDSGGVEVSLAAHSIMSLRLEK